VVMKNTWIILVRFVITLALASCAHESKVIPSVGHIDNQQTSKPGGASVADIPKLVKSTAFVPKPTAKTKEQTYSVVVNEVPVKEVLFALARESKLNIDIHPAIQGRVTLNAVDQTLPAILERLARQVDLTYKLEGNVLSITPDQPVLRSYKVDYVNMSRDTTGSVGVASEIASTGRAASTGGAGGSSSDSGGTTNSSKTLVSSESKNHFWATLIANIKDILAETDKEVIITRTGSTAQSDTPAAANLGASSQGASATSQAANQATNAATAAKEREEARTEYKTLFAATVIANQEAGIISVRGTSKQHERVQEFLDKVMTSAKRQVLIEATIVEVQLSDGYQAGIDWSRLNNSLTSSGFTFQQTFRPQITASSSNTTASPGLVAGYLNPVSRMGNIAASISLLKQFGETKVLSSPKLMVLNNQTAVLKVVDNLVYFTVQSQITQSTSTGSNSNSLQSVTTTPNTVPIGVVMSVTPQINDGGEVNINVRPTISSLIRYVPDPNPQIVAINNQGIPEIQVREMESMLQINSGSTAVLGGLMQDQIRRNTDKVPGLSDIPGIGRVFTGRNDVSKKTELVIFLRPTVIKNASLESDELQSYKQYLPAPQLEQSVPGNDY
jgi:MSHA biogenesis protein MshL